MLDIVNPEDDGLGHHDHDHDHGDGEKKDEKDGEEEEEEDEDEEEDETDEQYEKRLAEAKEKFKAEREAGYKKQAAGVFKHLFRSKGFIWLSNRPQLFFEWSQASVGCNISVGGPWLCTIQGESLKEQAAKGNIGDRAQNLIFIGQNMKQMREQIEAMMDECLVTDGEWEEMCKNNFTQEIENDPFKESVFEDD